jgi:hypothetical protein
MKTFHLKAIYGGRDRNGHHILTNVTGTLRRDWYYVNGQRGNFPSNVPVGSIITFYASPIYTKAGPRITDVREVEIIEEGQG